MCGRTVCTLDPAAICKSCAYKDRSGNVVQPGWRAAPTGDVYLPSYNIPPTSFTFYEWKQTTKPKQPYFIRYRPGSCGSESREGCKNDPLSIKKENASVGPGHLDGELMKMAGIFDVWMDQSTGEPLYSYCVITVDGSSTIGDIHDRMPAVLQNDDEVTRWLDSQTHPLDEAAQLVRPVERVDCYAVSTFVSSVRNNSPECIAPLVERKPPTSSPTGLMKWFVKTSDGERKVGGGAAEAASACVERGSATPPPAARGIKRRCDAAAAVENEAERARTTGKMGDG